MSVPLFPFFPFVSIIAAAAAADAAATNQLVWVRLGLKGDCRGGSHVRALLSLQPFAAVLEWAEGCK